MNHLFRTSVIVFSLLTSAGAFAQNTQKLSTSKNNEYGLTYSLPSTTLDITIEVKHTVSTPGEFFNYAKRYLDVDGVIVDPAHEVAVQSVTIVPRGVAQPNDLWLVKFKNGSNVSMTLTESGTPLSINSDNVTLPQATVLPSPREAQPTALEVPEAKQAVTQEMSATSSLSKKAQLAAQRIFELRENRNELLSGSAENMPPDGKALELILNNISAQEAALMAMFTGTVTEYTTVRTFSYTPARSKTEPVVIARLSPVDGLVEADDLSGDPITASLIEISEGKLPVNDKGEPKTFPKGGVAYNVPGSATIEISMNDNIFASKAVDIAQFGVVFGLDPSLFSDKKNPSFVEFSPVTGAIVRLGNVSDEK